LTFICVERVTSGLKMIAGQRVETRAGNGAYVTLSLGWSGFMAPLIRLLYGPLSRRYVAMEAQGQKALRSESLCSPLKEARVLLAAVRAAKEGDVRIADAEARLTQCEWALDQRVAPKQRVIVYDGTTE
jgi:hypothetical protein